MRSLDALKPDILDIAKVSKSKLTETNTRKMVKIECKRPVKRAKVLKAPASMAIKMPKTYQDSESNEGVDGNVNDSETFKVHGTATSVEDNTGVKS